MKSNLPVMLLKKTVLLPLQDLRLDLNDPWISERDREKYIYHFDCKDKHK